MTYNYIFGPVLSRRLGVSLGIDLVPHKVCSFDCVYCECGITTEKVMARRPYIPFAAIQAELDSYFSEERVIDYITLTGSGEPTLNSDIGKIVQYIKQAYPRYRIAVLTNASLLDNTDVCDALLQTDLVVPSLDAATETVFRKIDKPEKDVHIVDIIRHIAHFRHVFSGALWLELFIVPGINDTPEEIAAFRQAIQRIAPDRVQLNSLDRPGAWLGVKTATYATLQTMANALATEHPYVEVVKRGPKDTAFSDNDWQGIVVSSIARRPVTLPDLESITHTPVEKLEQFLAQLVSEGRVYTAKKDGHLFFVAKK